MLVLCRILEYNFCNVSCCTASLLGCVRYIVQSRVENNVQKCCNIKMFQKKEMYSTVKATTGEKKKFDYKWVIVALSFLMVMICLGFCSSPKSLFIGPVTDALGIKRSLFSINDSMRFISTAVINIFFGSLINRYGAKKLICAGFISLILFCHLHI